MNIPLTEDIKTNEVEVIEMVKGFMLSDDCSELSNPQPDDTSCGKVKQPGKANFRKSKPFQPIILSLTFLMLCLSSMLAAQLTTSVELGAAYTDNVFQLSDYDIQRYETNNPELKFIKASDDVILGTRLRGAYEMQWHWWKIQPSLQINASRNILNPDKKKFDGTMGVQIKRRLGEIGFYYGVYPNVYLRDYIDTDGTNQLQAFEYGKNQIKADLKVKPFSKSVASFEFKNEDYFYNEYFTEFDGNIETWTLGWQQSLPVFYLDAAYSYKVYETEVANQVNVQEDASFESNIYNVGIQMKKMPLDAKLKNIQWRPELKLGFEQRYFQGTDSWHAGRTDTINNTEASVQFYFGKNWNINLDYSYVFRNVEAMNQSIQKYKDYNENRFGISTRYQF